VTHPPKEGACHDTAYPLPAIDSVTPAVGRPGETLNVTIASAYTKFVQGVTQARFGVGGSPDGGFGPVMKS